MAVVRVLFGDDRAVTGVLAGAPGCVLTCASHLKDAPPCLSIELQDGRRLEAELRGRHLGLDVALIELTGLDQEKLARLPRLKFAAELSSEPAAPGTFVTVLGMALDDRAEPTQTFGIVSALNRLGGVAQTDARIHADNAGGAVLDRSGQLMGIATHLDESKPWAQSSGVGFFATTAEIAKVLDDLRAGKVLHAAPPTFLGLRPAVSETPGDGVRLAEVVPDSPAYAANLRAGDVVTELAGKPLRGWADLVAELRRKHAGEVIEVRYVRDGRCARAEAKLAAKGDATEPRR